MNDPLLRNKAGVSFALQGRLQDAIREFDAAAELAPEFPDPQVNAARATREQGKLEEARTRLQRILACWPEHAGASLEMAYLCSLSGDLDGEIHFYRKALLTTPDDATAHWNLALALLKNGDLEEGFAEFEWRFRCPQYAPFAFHSDQISAWQGQELGGKSILLICEQGLGDAIQFIRYANLIHRQGSQVFVRCAAAMKRLLSTCEGVCKCFSTEEDLPSCDYWASLLSLPHLCKTPPQQFPSPEKYLAADATLTRNWGQRLQKELGLAQAVNPQRRLRVGICWQGSPANPRDPQRSMVLQDFAPLFDVDGVDWISLQKQAESPSPIDRGYPVLDLTENLDTSGDAFCDTAAVMQHLDLVIGCDSAVCHLAGSLGIPVWLALDTHPDWRWQRQGTSTMWYPSTQLFRQTHSGVWSSVIQPMRQRLKSLVLHQE